MAAGAGVLVLILLVLGFRGCLNARKERAYQDYVRDTSSLVRESNQQSEALFRLLGGSDGGDDVDITNQLNGFARQSEQIVDRARETDVPDELNGAQASMVETFEFREDGVRAIAKELPTAIAAKSDSREGSGRIAASMQNFLASDVVYQTRVQPEVRGELESANVASEPLPASSFLPELDWLDPGSVADRVADIGTGGGSADDGDAAPGLHGTGVAAATLGGQALSAGASTSVSSGDDLELDVQVANQGENTETDVKVTATLGGGSDAIKLDGTLDEIAAGETKSVKIPVDETPPTGQNVPITVKVAKVPGEKKTDNNEEEYSAIFTN